MNATRSKILRRMCNEAAYVKFPPQTSTPGRARVFEHRRRLAYARDLYRRVKRAHTRLPWTEKSDPRNALRAAALPTLSPDAR